MNNQGERDWQLREYTLEDIPHYVDLINLEYPDEPTSVEHEEHWNRAYPEGNPRLRLAIEDAAGRLIGYAESSKPFWAIAPGVYMLYILSHPTQRGKGIGRELLGRLESYSLDQGVEKLWTDCRESQAHSIRFLERAGFTRFGIRFEAALDLNRFEPEKFSSALERVKQAGYALTTLAELRQERPDADRELYEVHHVGMKDVPLPGGIRIDLGYEQWRKNLDGPGFDPALTVLAMSGNRIVGMTSVELLPDGPAITDSTTVLREHRNHGVALALKVSSLRALKERGRAEARTHNDTENPTIIHLNEKLGYARLPGWLQWEKRLR